MSSGPLSQTATQGFHPQPPPLQQLPPLPPPPHPQPKGNGVSRPCDTWCGADSKFLNPGALCEATEATGTRFRQEPFNQSPGSQLEYNMICPNSTYNSPPPSLPPSLTPALIHPLTHSLAFFLAPSITPSILHSFPPSLLHSLAHSPLCSLHPHHPVISKAPAKTKKRSTSAACTILSMTFRCTRTSSACRVSLHP